MLCAPVAFLALASVFPLAAMATPASPSPALPQPTQLQVLEQRMAQLRITSERWAQATDVSGIATFEESRIRDRPRVTHRRTHVHAMARGEATVSPAASEIFVSGTPSLLTVGSTLYVYSPEPSGVGCARPWVRSQVPALARLPAPYPFAGNPREVDLGGRGAYAGLINLLATAVTPVRVGGPAVVDGQQTTGFVADVEPSRLVRGLTPKQLAEIPAHERIEAFITEGGVPARLAEVTTSGSTTVRTRIDILARNVPLHIRRPPLRRTRRESSSSVSSGSW